MSESRQQPQRHSFYYRNFCKYTNPLDQKTPLKDPLSDVVVDAKPGKANEKVVGGASIDPLDAADPSSVPSGYQMSGTFHVHPKGMVSKKNSQGKSFDFSFDQGPSGGDLEALKNTATFGKGNHFVLGARSGKVTILNSKGILATFPLQKFRTLK